MQYLNSNLFNNDLINKSHEREEEDYNLDVDEDQPHYHNLDLDEDEQIEVININPTYPNFYKLYAEQIQGMSKHQAKQFIESKQLNFLDKSNVQKSFDNPDNRDHAQVGTGRPITPKGIWGFPQKHSTNRNTRQFKSVITQFEGKRRIRVISDGDRVNRYTKQQTKINHDKGIYSHKFDASTDRGYFHVNDTQIKLLKQSFGQDKKIADIIRMLIEIECDYQQELNNQ
nr:hypothetical protein [Moritella viscosa]SHO03609.1 TonB-dependent receptor [Moritella viscosa]